MTCLRCGLNHEEGLEQCVLSLEEQNAQLRRQLLARMEEQERAARVTRVSNAVAEAFRRLESNR